MVGNYKVFRKLPFHSDFSRADSIIVCKFYEIYVSDLILLSSVEGIVI